MMPRGAPIFIPGDAPDALRRLVDLDGCEAALQVFFYARSMDTEGWSESAFSLSTLTLHGKLKSRLHDGRSFRLIPDGWDVPNCHGHVTVVRWSGAEQPVSPHWTLVIERGSRGYAEGEEGLAPIENEGLRLPNFCLRMKIPWSALEITVWPDTQPGGFSTDEADRAQPQ